MDNIYPADQTPSGFPVKFDGRRKAVGACGAGAGDCTLGILRKPMANPMTIGARVKSNDV